MRERPKIDLALTGYDEMFMNDQERAENRLPKIYDIPLNEIDDFPDHPFKVRLDEDMDQLVESVKSRGVITPVTLRQKEDGRYEIVSGHRRRKACELAGLETVPAEIKKLTRDEAIILMVESNLQRSVILPSEKAFANLIDHQTEVYLDGEIIATQKVESLKQYVENLLPYLDFNELVDIPEWVMDEHLGRGVFRKDLQFMQHHAWGNTYDLCVEVSSYMKNGSMFADLCNYTDKNFYEEHKTIQFDTLSSLGQYEVVAVFKFNTNKEDFRYNECCTMNEKAFKDFMSQVNARQLYDTGVDAEYGDQLLTLSTCEYTYNNGRLVVVAKKVN